MADKYFLACEGNWQISNGVPVCDGFYQTLTSQEIAQTLGGEGITYVEFKPLLEQTVVLFSIVFVFLVIRKAIS